MSDISNTKRGYTNSSVNAYHTWMIPDELASMHMSNPEVTPHSHHAPPHTNENHRPQMTTTSHNIS
jgi:hypothetical protein